MTRYKLLTLAIAGLAGCALSSADAQTQTRHIAPTPTVARASGYSGSGYRNGGNWGGYRHSGNWGHHRYYRGGSNFSIGLGLGYPFGFGYGYPYGYGYDYGYGYGYPYGYGYGYDAYSQPVVRGEVVAGNGGYGNVVARVQQRLARAGYYRGSIDGVIGSGTRRAIRAYERANGLRVDGEIDNQLLATMGLA